MLCRLPWLVVRLVLSGRSFCARIAGEPTKAQCSSRYILASRSSFVYVQFVPRTGTWVRPLSSSRTCLIDAEGWCAGARLDQIVGLSR